LICLGLSRCHHEWQHHRPLIAGILSKIAVVTAKAVLAGLMTEKNTDEQNTENPPAARKPYLKPEFRYERAFETMVLSCGKIRATQALCRFNRKNS
jgi:hypothetical protein